LSAPPLPSPRELTRRQKQVVALKGLGLGPRAIASRLGISPATVAAHMTWIRRRLELERGERIPTDLPIPAVIAREITPRRFCDRCGLSEPHECLDVRYLATARRGD
jgi:Bacterial regulatory proteins, luxR family